MPRESRRARKPSSREPHLHERAVPQTGASAPPRMPVTTLVLWGLLGLALLYVSLGLWPILPLEGDETAIANGAAQLAQTPTLDRNELYRYHFQPLPYTVLASGARWLGIEPLTTLGVLTWLGFFSFFGFSIRFCSRLVGISFAAAGLVLLLFQETYTAAYYANTSMIAAGLLAPAALLRTRGTWRASLGAGLLAALAIMCRFDALLMLPVLAVIGLERNRAWLVRSALFAGSAVLALLVLMGLLGVSLASIRGEVTAHTTLCTMVGFALMNYLTLFNFFVGALAVVGLGVCLVRRDWTILTVSLLGLVPLVAAYGRSVTTPKYMLFAIPFVALAVAVALRWVAQLRNLRWRAVALLLVAVFYLQQYAWHLTGPSIQEQFTKPNEDICWTADAFRMRTAFAMAPWMWSNLKSYAAANLATCDRELRKYTAENPTGDIVANTTDYWLSNNALVYEMRQCGYSPAAAKPKFPEPETKGTRPTGLRQPFENRQGQTCQVIWLDPFLQPRAALEVFLVDQARSQPRPPQAGAPRPYTFFHFFWSIERSVSDIPARFERVDVDLRQAEPRK